jgi:DmsE family decaheme c-type cytochrome
MRRTLKSLFAWLQFPAIALAGAFFISDAVAQQRTPDPALETCKNCHADRVESYKATKHGQAGNLKGPDCMTCHGAGALEHAKAGGGKGVGGIVGFSNKAIPAEQKSATCLSCHQGSKRTHWQMSTHATRDVSCNTCHEVHGKDKARDKRTQSEVCFACHKEQRAQISRQSRHPTLEGKVACSDCHNPHGSAGEKLLVRDNVNDTCYTCHMEKRGPFVRTHQPVQENCAICHNPHGSINDNLLRTRQPFLCQQCHEPTSHRGNFASTTAGRPGSNESGQGVTMARACLNCHTNIHGTNNPRDVSNERTFRR